MLECAYWAQNQSSYEAAEHTVKKIYGININDDTLRFVTNEIGRIVFDRDCRRAEEIMALYDAGKIPFSRTRKGVLYIAIDGATLNTRHNKDEGCSSWQENKLGIVFSSDNIRVCRNSKTGELEHRIEAREYVACLGAASEFKKHLFACAVRNGYGQYRRTVILSDGTAWTASIVSELFHDAHHILDFYHLRENVLLYAKEFFHREEAKYIPWANRICKMLKQGKRDEALAELATMPEIHNHRCASLFHYIKNNIDHIDYPSYIDKGLFIGSGAVNSDTKVVLQKRLRQAGMRWEEENAQYILTLKSKQESSRWSQDVVHPVKRHYGLA